MEERKGFTLIELLVVIAIIGLISTTAVVALQNARQKSRDAKRLAEIGQLRTAVELYENDNEAYPVPVPTAPILPGWASSDSASANQERWHGECASYPESLRCLLSSYMEIIFDPINSSNQLYWYVSSGTFYSIMFRLEGDDSLRCDNQAVPYNVFGQDMCGGSAGALFGGPPGWENGILYTASQ